MPSSQAGAAAEVSRAAALRALAAWRTGGAAAPRVLLLTGSPGSGRTRLLADFLAGPRHRPAPVVLGAAGRTAEQVLWELADRLGVAADSAEELHWRLAALPEPAACAIRDVDLAGPVRGTGEPARLAAGVLPRLAACPRLRLLLDLPRAAADRLAAGLPPEAVRVVDLDAPPYRDPAALLRQAERALERAPAESLRLLGAGTPAARRSLAAEVALAAGGSPLVVRLAVRSLLAAPEAGPGPLPAGLGEVLDVHADRLGIPELTLRRLLLPLALAEGDGLPAALWAPLASAVAGRRTALEPARARALLGPFLAPPAQEGSGRPLARLLHPAIAGEVRERCGVTVREAQRRVVRALLDRVPAVPGGPGGARDWPAADPYTRDRIAGHALEAGLLPELLADPGLPVHAAPVPLRAAVEHLAAAGAELPPAARPWLALAPLLTRTQAPAPLRAALLEHALHAYGLPLEAAAVHTASGRPLPWRTLWTVPLPGVRSVTAALTPDGAPAAVAAVPPGTPGAHASEQAHTVAYDAVGGARLALGPDRLRPPGPGERARSPFGLSTGADYLRVWHRASGRVAAVLLSEVPVAGADLTPDGVLLLATSRGLSALRITAVPAHESVPPTPRRGSTP